MLFLGVTLSLISYHPDENEGKDLAVRNNSSERYIIGILPIIPQIIILTLFYRLLNQCISLPLPQEV